MHSRVTIVVITHNRVAEVLRTIRRHATLPTPHPIVVVDNASSDGTAEAVAREFPRVTVVRARTNLGAAGRNAGLERAETPYVALVDDDAWWTGAALLGAANLLDAHARLAAVCARVVVGDEARDDPACRDMRESPLDPDPTVPGPRLLGFLAGATMVRRAAVLAVGGFEPRLFLGSEELLLGADLAAAGWQMTYADDLVVHHHPSRLRDAGLRRRLLARNDVWFAWRRLPVRLAVEETARLALRALHDHEARDALVSAVGGLRWALATRRPLPGHVVDDWRRLRAPGITRNASTSPGRTRRRVPSARPWRDREAASDSSRSRGV
jgi:GT2 family glycosyltransferase